MLNSKMATLRIIFAMVGKSQCQPFSTAESNYLGKREKHTVSAREDEMNRRYEEKKRKEKDTNSASRQKRLD